MARGSVTSLMITSLFLLASGQSKTRTIHRLSNVIKFNIPVNERNEMSVEGKKPKFCNGLDCPDFKVISKTKDYEERQYVKTNWVSTSLTGIDYKDATRKMFSKLFNYIQGKNERDEKINMTCPVITSIIPGQGPACESNFTMSFFMSPKAVDPPAPSDKTAFLSSLPEQTVFVKGFGGFASQTKWLENAEDLANALKKDGKKFNENFFYSAGYDSPFRILNRHNEVWFIGE